MHDPEAPPRLRWRLLAWGIAAILLAPVLYVAAAEFSARFACNRRTQ
jgi:hypothetical protein